MVKNLSLGDLELILCDWYEMDEQLPNPIFEKKEFERVSNGLWAIGEFRNYVSKQIYPETQTSIKNLREMACTFAKNDIVNIGLHFILKNVRPYAAPCSEA